MAYVSPWYGAHAYKFNSPTNGRVYVKILKFVASHPECTRKEIQIGVWGEASRGMNSTTFAHMIAHGLIGYDKSFRYTIKRGGKNILRKVNK